ncbi:Ig-like domain-containing protein [Streptomyces sp. x-80]|uniref:Ig-like domain-containing protein n=1 Tax=Streptomyces sp. x-80 TaxID=2789282 RepID=UPI00398089CC
MNSTILTRKRRLAAACAFTVMAAVGVAEAAPVFAADKAPVAAVQDAGDNGGSVEKPAGKKSGDKRAVAPEAGKKEDGGKGDKAQEKPAASKPGAPSAPGGGIDLRSAPTSRTVSTPVITSPSEGAQVGLRPTFTGTGTPGAKVELAKANTAVRYGTATVGTDGKWTITVDKALDVGDNWIQAQQNVSGELSEWGPGRNVKAAAITAPVVTSPSEGAQVGLRPAVTGTGIPGAKIELYSNNNDNVPLVTVTVGSDGKWTGTMALTPGDNWLVAKQTVSGETSALSSGRKVKAAAITAPVVTSPSEGAQVGLRPAVTGTGIPGAKIELYSNNNDNVPLVTVTVGSDGKWTGTMALTPGDNWLVAKQTVSGETSALSSGRKVKAAAITAPVVTSPSEGAQVGLRPAVTGTGIPGAKIELAKANSSVRYGTATVGTDGKWTITVDKDLDVGDNWLTTQQNVSGELSSWSSRRNVKAAAITAPKIIKPEADSTQPSKVKFEGTADAENGVTKVKLVDKGSGKEIGTYGVNAAGKWWISNKDLPTLASGRHTVEAFALTADGVQSKAATVSFTVRAQAGAPVIVKPAADSTQPSKVKFEGTADRVKGGVTKVRLADKATGKEIGTYSVGSTGNTAGQWWISNSALPTFKPGQHTVTATGITADGGETAASEVTFKVLADAPAPVITKPTAGSTVTGPLVKFEGTADSEKGIRKVRLADKDTGKEIGTYTVGSTGDIVDKWWISNPVLPTFKAGKHTVTATGITADGGDTAASEVTFTVK